MARVVGIVLLALLVLGVLVDPQGTADTTKMLGEWAQITGEKLGTFVANLGD